jgi:hypothetical protein
LGALVVSQTPIKPGIAIIFSISLGIAFGNSIYILLELKEMLKKKPESKKLPLLELLNHELGPCFNSALAAIATFSVFLFSSLSMNSIFGAFMILSVVAGMCGDLLLLPTTLSLFPKILLPLDKNVKWRDRLNAKKIAMSLFVAFMILMIPNLLQAAELDADEIFKKVEKAGSVPSEEVQMKMNIIEPDGAVKPRDLIVRKKQKGAEQKALVKILSPSDLKGVGLLTIKDGSGAEDQWLYLPSEKKSRRIIGSGKKKKFLDSELSYEDMRPSTYKNFNNTVAKTEKDKHITIVESTPKKKGDSSYGRIKSWVYTKDWVIIKTEYYDENDSLMKVSTFDNYKKFSGAWRAKKVTVKNVKKNRGTTMEIKDFSSKNIDDEDFSMSELEEG